MKAGAKLLVLIVAFVFAAPVCGPTGGERGWKEANSSLSGGRPTLARAVEIAQGEARDGLLVGAELRTDEPTPVYLVKLLVGDKIKEVWVDGVDGRVQGSRTREIAPEHRGWAAEFPGVMKRFGKTPRQMLEAAGEATADDETLSSIKYERREGVWVCEVSGTPRQQTGIFGLSRGGICFRLDDGEGYGGADQVIFYVNFDREAIDAPPRGLRILQTHPTEALATWAVIADPSAPSKPNVLALTRSENTDGTFNLAILGGGLKDLSLAVKVKAVGGKEDQGGGPIWRCRDENNYYVCRINPLEGNFRLYYVKDGVRKQLASAAAAAVAGQWCTVRVRMEGKHIVCYLDGKAMLEADDETFTGPGTFGLWTKADAVTSFDDLSFADLSLPENQPASRPANR